MLFEIIWSSSVFTVNHHHHIPTSTHRQSTFHKGDSAFQFFHWKQLRIVNMKYHPLYHHHDHHQIISIHLTLEVTRGIFPATWQETEPSSSPGYKTSCRAISKTNTKFTWDYKYKIRSWCIFSKHHQLTKWWLAWNLSPSSLRKR